MIDNLGSLAIVNTYKSYCINKTTINAESTWQEMTPGGTIYDAAGNETVVEQSYSNYSGKEYKLTIVRTSSETIVSSATTKPMTFTISNDLGVEDNIIKDIYDNSRYSLMCGEGNAEALCKHTEELKELTLSKILNKGTITITVDGKIKENVASIVNTVANLELSNIDKNISVVNLFFILSPYKNYNKIKD